MPIYQYRCQECQQRFEELTKIDDSEVKCPICGAGRDKVERQISRANFNFKGWNGMPDRKGS